jgi:hypothetical protein
MPKRGRVDNIKMDGRETEWGVMDWIDLDEDRNQWKVPFNMVMNALVPRNSRKFLSIWVTVGLSIKIPPMELASWYYYGMPCVLRLCFWRIYGMWMYSVPLYCAVFRSKLFCHRLKLRAVGRNTDNCLSLSPSPPLKTWKWKGNLHSIRKLDWNSSARHLALKWAKSKVTRASIWLGVLMPLILVVGRLR